MEKKTTIGEFLATALVSYIVTAADDLVVLMNFFTEASIPTASLKVHHIFIGQYISFSVVLALSLIGYALSYAVPVEMLGFLGFLPIYLGTKGIIEIIIKLCKKFPLNLDDINSTNDVSPLELGMIRYQNDVDGEIISEFTIHEQQQNPVLDTPVTVTFKQKILKLLSHCFNLQTLEVAAITLGNSGDNVGIYAPLFAQATNWQIVLYIVIFLIMVFVLLIFCYFFINYPPILRVAQNCAQYIVPIVFVGIGIYIIVTSNCFPWLVRAIRTKNFKNG